MPSDSPETLSSIELGDVSELPEESLEHTLRVPLAFPKVPSPLIEDL